MKSIANFDNDLSAEGNLQSSQHVKNAKEKKKGCFCLISVQNCFYLSALKTKHEICISQWILFFFFFMPHQS